MPLQLGAWPSCAAAAAYSPRSISPTARILRPPASLTMRAVASASKHVEGSKSSSPRSASAVDSPRNTRVVKDNATKEKAASAVAMLPLAEQVERFRPELLPLLRTLTPPAGAATTSHPWLAKKWEMETVQDAVRLSTVLQDRLLCLPEINRSAPCYNARSIVLLFTKLRYLATFGAKDVEEYGHTGETQRHEVELLRQLATVSSNAELHSRLAALLRIPSHGEQWHEIAKFVACALPFAEQTESLITRGSDDRSVFCTRSRANKYHTSPFPCSVDVARGSCTCSSMTLEAFAKCEKLRQELLLNALSINPNAQSASDFFDAKMSDVRRRLAACIGLRDLVDDDSLRILLTPSGTDAELVATSIALSRMFAGLESSRHSTDATPRVTSLIVAQGEIGRGSSSASGGKHFSSVTPSGEAGKAGAPLRRYPTDLVDVLEFNGRDDDGNLQNIDEAVYSTVTRLLAGDQDAGCNVVLLHVVMGAKTGFCCPTLEVVDLLARKHPNRLVVVIDACQMRLNCEAYRDFVAKGYVVLLTGSKFFAGAPFCGAVLVPMRSVYEMETAAVEEQTELCYPLGLEDYFSRYDFPAGMKHVRARMGSAMNVGLLLRWESALANMEPFARIPSPWIQRACRTYVDQCKSMLRSKWLHLVEILEPPSLSPRRYNRSANDQTLDSIISFKVRDVRRSDTNFSSFLDLDALRDLHMLLAKDLSNVLPQSVVKLRCVIGQPVQLGKSPLAGTVLRIAVGADMINGMHYRQDVSFESVVNDLVSTDDQVLSKMQVILEHWDVLQQQFVEEQASPSSIEPAQPLSDWNFAVKKASISRVVRQMRIDGILASEISPQTLIPSHGAVDFSEPAKVAVVYDLDAIDMAFQSLLTSFPSHFEHRFAVKSCPLAFFVKLAIENDVGLECASIVEVQHALRLGCAADKIVFDSPCKTRREIAFALHAGVEVNADNFDELDIIREHAEAVFQSDFPECTPRFAGRLPRIGLRVNPLLGAGTNECLSVSTAHSKFGVPLTDSNRKRIIGFFRENPWMTGLHCHVGSQGCTLEMLARGAAIISELATEIDAAAGATRVKVLNIGGGLPANYDSDDIAPTFADYVNVLRRHAPQLFERTGRTILTEFGRSVSSKTGWIISEVEYVKRHDDIAPHDSIRQTAVIHAGSDLFVRTCYRPELFPHRLSVYKYVWPSLCLTLRLPVRVCVRTANCL